MTTRSFAGNAVLLVLGHAALYGGGTVPFRDSAARVPKTGNDCSTWRNSTWLVA